MSITNIERSFGELLAAFVAEALFVPGSSRPPADLLNSFLGGPLTAGPLLADLRRAG